MGTGDRFTQDSYALISGPPSLRGYSLDAEWATSPAVIDSQDVHEFAEYPTNEVLAALLGLPDVRLISEPGWRGARWAAAWECGDRLILFEQVDESEEEMFWSVHLRCDCRVGDVLNLWEPLRQQFPGLWLLSPKSKLLSPGAFFLEQRDFDPQWRTSNVLALARGIHADAAFDRLPILADALQDAGCDDIDILERCRSSNLHTAGCWVVELVLSSPTRKEPLRITDWGEFYRRLLIDPPYGEPAPKPTVAQLDQFETETGFRLPQSYRDYITVFGPGKIFTDWVIAAPGYGRGSPYDLQTMDENMRLAEYLMTGLPEEQRERLRRCRHFCYKYKESFWWDPAEVCDPATNEYAIYRTGGLGSHHDRVASSFREFIEAAYADLFTWQWDEGNPDLGPRLRFEPVASPTS